MAQIVTNETPIGVIGGNTIYTLSLESIKIMSVIVDGIEIPSAYTIAGKVLTMTVAPVTSITVDYIAK